MAPQPRATGLKALRAHHYVVAGLTATLAATVVITVVSAVLSPAHVNFFVADARNHSLGNGGTMFSFTLAISHNSSRAKVQYRSMFVDVSNSTGPPWTFTTKAQLDQDVHLLPPQPRNVTTYINVTVPLLGAMAEEFTAGGTTTMFTVMITAQVKFKVGIAPTRLYDIQVSCLPVRFPAESEQRSAAVKCQ